MPLLRDPHVRDLASWEADAVTIGYGDDVTGRGSLANRIARLVSRALRDAKDENVNLGRAEVASRMSEILGRSVTAAKRFALNSHGFGIHVDDKLQGTAPTSMGSQILAISANRSSTAAVFRDVAGASADLVTVGGRGGLFQASRSDATGYRVGYKQSLQTIARPSTTMGTINNSVLIMAENGVGGAKNFSTITPAFAFVSEALTDDQMLGLDLAITKYATNLAALGA